MTCADCLNSAPELLLALNGADERLQLALGRWSEDGGAQLLASQEWTVPGQSARFLAPGIRQMLDSLGLQARAIRSVACVHGPGSFTGLRMSLALAEGLAAGMGAKLGGVDHLALLAHDAAQIAPGAVLALAWSRRGQVYAQAFADRRALNEPSVQHLPNLPQFMAALPRPLHLLGGGLRRNLPFFQELAAADPSLRLLPAHWDAPKPEALLTLATQASFNTGPLTPVYLRASDAEDNLAAIAAGRGLSQAEAQAILSRGSRTLS